MCDTLGRIAAPGRALFAKNSDRSPNEPQVLEWFPASYPAEKTLRATYIEIPQASATHALLLSRPVWMWGGEMGVNEHGVCIGNEAVFTKGAYGKTGLTGMDLVRLGLERGATAREALDVIVALLTAFGQGGNCGYDHNFFYDNSFLILDRQDIFVLETAGKNWVLKRSDAASISNRLSIATDGDRYSAGATENFKRRYLEPVYSFFSGSRYRLEQTAHCLAGAPDIAGLMAGLRTHTDNDRRPLATHSVGSACMHAGGAIGDHTTASMVVEVGEQITVWATGCSTPCIVLFLPWRLGNAPRGAVFAAGDPRAERFWRDREAFHRAAVGHVLPPDFYARRDALEAAWRKAAANASDAAMDELSRRAAEEAAAFYAQWRGKIPAEVLATGGFMRYWKKKNAALDTPRPAGL